MAKPPAPKKPKATDVATGATASPTKREATDALCDDDNCTSTQSHVRGVRGCFHGPGGHGRPMKIDPDTHELATDADGNFMIDEEAEAAAARASE